VSTWTDERTELAVKLWQGGKTAAEVAKALGGVTRNAVIGRMHRMGLSRRDPATLAHIRNDGLTHRERYEIKRKHDRAHLAKPTRATVEKRERALGVRAIKALIQPETLREKLACRVVPHMIGILDLRPSHCRWPYDVPGGFAYCGHSKARGSYCRDHARAAYIGGSDKLFRDNQNNLAEFILKKQETEASANWEKGLAA
jgi:GcrA cell cycle regulator